MKQYISGFNEWTSVCCQGLISKSLAFIMKLLSANYVFLIGLNLCSVLFVRLRQHYIWVGEPHICTLGCCGSVWPNVALLTQKGSVWLPAARYPTVLLGYTQRIISRTVRVTPPSFSQLEMQGCRLVCNLHSRGTSAGYKIDANFAKENQKCN